MKHKFKITFDVSVEYPHLKKMTKKISKDFNDYLKKWVDMHDEYIVPVLYDTKFAEHIGDATIKASIEQDGKTTQQTTLIQQGSR